MVLSHHTQQLQSRLNMVKLFGAGSVIAVLTLASLCFMAGPESLDASYQASQRKVKTWIAAPFIFVSINQRLHAPEISGFSKKLTPYIVVVVYIIYNILYLVPDDSNLMGFSKKLSVSA